MQQGDSWLTSRRPVDWRLALIVVAAVATVLRAPYLFTNARFWAEEGYLYFHAAYHLRWYDALLYPHQGYYSLVPNLMTLVASRAVPLDHAPLFTAIAAAAIQQLPYFVVLYRLAPTLRPLQQILYCLGTAVVVHTGEVWISTSLTHFHLGAVTALLALADHSRVSRGWALFDRIVIGVSGLTGVVSCFVLPAFALRALRERQRNLIVLTAILGAAAIVQLGYILLGPAHPNRFHFPGWSVVIETWSRIFVLLPFFGGSPHRILVSPWLERGATLILLTAILLVAFRSRRKESIAALVAFVCLSVLQLIGSIDMVGGIRYAYAPAICLLGLFILNAGADGGRARWDRIVSIVLVLSAIGLWIPHYRSSLSPWIVAAGPVWKEEVRVWRENPDRPLRIYPQWIQNPWFTKLAGPISCGFSIDASYDPMEDADGYRLRAAAETAVVIDVDAAELGSALDSVVGAYDCGMRRISINDDAPATNEAVSTDSFLKVDVPSDGCLHIAVSSKGDEDFDGVGGLTQGPYRLTVSCRERDDGRR